MPGSQPSQPLNTRMSTVAETNSGMVMAPIASDDSTKSRALSRRRAAKMPAAKANGKPTAKAVAPSSKEFLSRSATMLLMGLLLCADKPRSP